MYAHFTNKENQLVQKIQLRTNGWRKHRLTSYTNTFEAPYINFPKNMVLSERQKKPYEIGGGDEFITQGPG